MYSFRDTNNINNNVMIKFENQITEPRTKETVTTLFFVWYYL